MESNQNNIKYNEESCFDIYCPCCPRCNCDFNCNCDCGCNCSKKKFIIPTFIISAITFILVLIEIMTKVSDTNIYLQLTKVKYDINEIENKDVKNIYEIENMEDTFSLICFCFSLFIFFIYLILLLCFIYENSCFKTYNPECKKPYYYILMLVNFIALLSNSMISFSFFSYRVNSINKYKSYVIFNHHFWSKNDLNIALDIICGFGYLLCIIFHLITCYYLYKEDGICTSCCQQFFSCVDSFICLIRCLLCCWCCCCEKPKKKRRKSINKNPNGRNVVVIHNQQNYSRSLTHHRPSINSNTNKQILQQSSLVRNNLNDEFKIKIDSVCQKTKYSSNFSQFKLCNLCKSYFRHKEKISVLPCGHIYHSSCIYNWFTQNNTCPEDGTDVFI